MKEEEIKEIMACLPKGRTLFHYFKDRYALMLLADFVGEGMAVRDVRASRFGPLLDRGVVRNVVATKGDGMLEKGDLESAWPNLSDCYVLTLGRWGTEHSKHWSRSYHQMVRRGLNLVLQLNFTKEHDRRYQELMRPNNCHPFEFGFHPTAARRGRRTLAWARVDLDLASGEALIEEIQNDWLREVRTELEWCPSRKLDQNPYALRVRRYADEVLSVHQKQWEEAMLSAAIWFLSGEIGIDRIYYHDFESGNRLKGLSRRWSQPPRSLYTKLPKRFCFERTTEMPTFLAAGQSRPFRKELKEREPVFWRLQ